MGSSSARNASHTMRALTSADAGELVSSRFVRRMSVCFWTPATHAVPPWPCIVETLAAISPRARAWLIARSAVQSTVPHQQVASADSQALLMHQELLLTVAGHANDQSPYNLGFFAVLHQLCKVLGAKANAGRLYRWVEVQLGIATPGLLSPRRATFESRRIHERHALVALALWLLCDLPLRLTAAWRDKAVRFNHLLKDFHQPPRWYADVCTALKRSTSSVRTRSIGAPNEQLQ